jgi:hypothetical protein
MAMRVLLVCGDRNWQDADRIYAIVKEAAPALLIHGDAKGADRMGMIAGLRLGVRVEAHPADWKLYGKGAGPIRNQQMLGRLLELERGGAQVACVAFHSNLSESKGTADMVRRCREAGIQTEVYE